jgi:MFS transporter, FSR family, fosmidomycin resistance protein
MFGLLVDACRTREDVRKSSFIIANLRNSVVAWRLPIFVLLGLAHAFADGAAGWLIGDLSRSASPRAVVFFLLLYNGLAFGLQPIFGFVIDRKQFNISNAAFISLLLVCTGLWIGRANMMAGVAALGLGSSLFHVSAGAIALSRAGGRSAPIGFFTAPGVLGLAIGGSLAVQHVDILSISTIALSILALLIAVSIRKGSEPSNDRVSASSHGFDPHDLIMAGLLVAIALRSLVWTALNHVLAGQTNVLWLLAIAAAIGKFLGGYCADWIGHRLWTLSALLGSAVLLGAWGDWMPTLLIGTALLQSATPVMLVALAARVPKAPATAAGLGLGLAIAVGGLPFALTTGTPTSISIPIAVLALSSAGFIGWLSLPSPPDRSRPAHASMDTS